MKYPRWHITSEIEWDIAENHEAFCTYRLKVHLIKSFGDVVSVCLTQNTWSQQEAAQRITQTFISQNMQPILKIFEFL